VEIPTPEEDLVNTAAAKSAMKMQLVSIGVALKLFT
jgi:hypothetical protein